MQGRIEDDKKRCRELLERFPVTFVREIAQEVEYDKEKRLQGQFTRYIRKLSGSENLVCYSVDWDVHVDSRRWEDDIEWDIGFKYENQYYVTLRFYRDQLCTILYANDQTKCIVRYYKNKVHIDKITEEFMPSAKELECIRLVLGIGIRPNCHDLDGTFDTNIVHYFHKHAWSCYKDGDRFYRLESVYTVLLIHKHCPECPLARLSKDVLKLILVKCI